MKTNIEFNEFLDKDGKQIINKIEYSLSDTIKLTLSKNIKDGVDICNLKMEDLIGVSELETQLNKQNIRELIELIKKIYNQL